MTVTVTDVTTWAKQSTPPTNSDEYALVERLIGAVKVRAFTYFGLDLNPENWTDDQNQAVIEVTAEQWIGGRNTQFGMAESLDGSPVYSKSIDHGLKRRLGGAKVGFA